MDESKRNDKIWLVISCLSGCNYYIWKPVKKGEKRFLFHVKSSILSQDISIFGHVEKRLD